MPACNYFYLHQSAISPLRHRLKIIHDGGFLADPLFSELIGYVDTISESIDYYSSFVKIGLGEK